MRREDQRGGNGSVPGTRRKAVPIAMATGPAEYMVNWVNIRTQMLGRGDVSQDTFRFSLR